MMAITKTTIKKIRKDILKMVKKDQDLRYKGKLNATLDKTNTEKLKLIISQIGWPKINLVGKKASNGAWLIVQHAIHDLRFQKKCLKLMKHTTKEKEIDIKLIPLLEDRILVNEGKKQIYGTQFYKDKKTGKLIPKPIKIPKQVDALRKSVGLEPLTIYQSKLNKMVQQIEKRNKKQINKLL